MKMPLPPNTPLRTDDWPILLQRLDRLYTRITKLDWALTPQRCLAISDLLLRLKQDARLPTTAQGLCDHLAPLLCCSQAQQAQFAAIFYAWLHSSLLLARQSTEGKAKDTLADKATKERNAHVDPQTPARSVFAVSALSRFFSQNLYQHPYRYLAASLLLISLLLGTWQFLESWQVAKQNADESHDTAPSLSPRPQASPLVNSGPVSEMPPQACSETPLQQCWSSEPSVWDFLQDPRFWLLLLSPVLVLCLIHPLLQARQRLDRARLPRPEQPLHSVQVKPFASLPFSELAMAWPQQTESELASPLLHERKTLDKTLQHLERGALQSVYRQCRESVRYLVLIDRPHAADHCSVLADHLLAALQGLPVELRVYNYWDDPRWCYPQAPLQRQHKASPAAKRAVSLASLHHADPDARLLLLGQAHGLFHELSGRLYPWTEIFQRWTTRICLVHEAQPWGAKQKALAEQGFLLAPLTSKGVTTLIDWLQQQAQYGSAPSHEGYWFGGLQAQHFPDVLRGDAWVSDDRPRTRQEKRRFRQLIQQLQRYLKNDASLLLAACAAYPEINGHLTLALEAQLFPQAASHERQQRLLKLCNLPWMQHGAMPQYLRAYLLNSLSDHEFQSVSHVLNQVLTWSAQQTGPLVLERPILLAPQQMTEPWWQQRLAELRNIWQQVKHKRHQASLSDDDSIDLLLLKTLRGRSINRLNFIPEALTQRWRQQSAWWSPLVKHSLISVAAILCIASLYPLVMTLSTKTADTALSIPIAKMVSIPSGSFDMGCLSNDSDCRDDEKPVHRVNISAFKMSTTAVTFAQYDYYCEQTDQDKPSDESWGRGDRPVINVSWENAQAYIQWLNEQTGQSYRLPTEAEWEYAARAGSSTKYSWGDKPSGEYANGSQETFGGDETWPEDGFENTALVGNYKPNAWGLYDMHGNVLEWVQDGYEADYYQNSPTSNPQGPAEGSSPYRVLRGGSWYDDAQYLRSAFRLSFVPDFRLNSLGFRLSLGE